MIDARELRIGNWVFDSDRDNPYFHQVARIETREYTDWNDGDGFNVVCLLEGSKDSYFDLIPSPIPLTEEWLLRLGFTKNNSSEFSIEIQNGWNIVWQSCGYIYLKYHENECEVSHMNYNSVHQIQNLYHSLTGQELEIK